MQMWAKSVGRQCRSNAPCLPFAISVSYKIGKQTSTKLANGSKQQQPSHQKGNEPNDDDDDDDGGDVCLCTSTIAAAIN